MSDQIDSLKSLWTDSKNTMNSQSLDTSNIIGIAKQKMKSTIKMQIGTILILLITLAGISAFLIYGAKFSQLFSLIGSGLMIGGLVLRILMELLSVYLSANIDFSESVLKTNTASFAYFRFRRLVNGPVTIGILILYTIGFYMLTPEFSMYFDMPLLVMIDLSYIVGAAIFTWFIIKTIKKETNTINEIIRIQHAITKDEKEGL